MKIGIIASKMSNVLIKCRVHWSPEMVEQVMLGMDFQLSRENFWKSVWMVSSPHCLLCVCCLSAQAMGLAA